MGTLAYQRRFVLEAAHFNGANTYSAYASAQKAAESGNWSEAFSHLEKVLFDCHGHSFEIKVAGSRKLRKRENEDYVVVWDEQLEAVVREWDRCNLTVHPDFKLKELGLRVTTEMMCGLLKHKLEKRFPDLNWTVAIKETDDIEAVVT